MTMDRSLKNRSGLKGRRSVMTRAERIAHMADDGTFDTKSDNPFGLPKLRTRTSKVGTKTVKKDETLDA